MFSITIKTPEKINHEKPVSLKLPIVCTNISQFFNHTKHLYNFLTNVTSKIKASPPHPPSPPETSPPLSVQ